MGRCAGGGRTQKDCRVVIIFADFGIAGGGDTTAGLQNNIQVIISFQAYNFHRTVLELCHGVFRSCYYSHTGVNYWRLIVWSIFVMI